MYKQIVKDKTAQTGDTITWLVATVVIVVVLAVSIFAAINIFDKKKSLSSGTFQFVDFSDTLASKSLFSYVLTKNSNGETFYQGFKNGKDLDEVNGILAKNIFLEFYKDEYSKVWFGFISIEQYTYGISTENKYFGKRTQGTQKEEFELVGNQVSETIKLNEKSGLNLLLYDKK